MQLRHQELGLLQFEDFTQSIADAPIQSDCTDEGDRGRYCSAFDDTGFKVACYGVAKAAQNLVSGVALLLGVDHVALGEHRTASGNTRCASRRRSGRGGGDRARNPVGSD